MHQYIKPSSQNQINIGSELGLDVSRDSWNVARAKLLDLIGDAIGDLIKYTNPTKKQIEFGKELGIDVSKNSFRVAIARIKDALTEKNLRAIEELQLVPGDQVVLTRWLNFNGISEKLKEKFIVSSIRKDGLVYFKGGNGRCAWAGKLRKIGGNNLTDRKEAMVPGKQKKGISYEKSQARKYRGKHLGGPGKPDYKRGKTKGEVKNWARPVHSGVTREAIKKGIKEIVSKSGFTKPAEDIARKKGVKLIKRGKIVSE